MMKKYRLNPDLDCCVDIYDLKLIDRKNNTCISLAYPQAVIWDLLHKNYPLPAIIRMMANIGKMNVKHAETVVHEALDYFYANQILTGD